MCWPPSPHRTRSSPVFSLFGQLIRWSLILMIAAATTLAAFFGSLRYEGRGRFQFSLKKNPGLEGTLVIAAVSPAGTAAEAAPPKKTWRKPKSRKATKNVAPKRSKPKRAKPKPRAPTPQKSPPARTGTTPVRVARKVRTLPGATQCLVIRAQLDQAVRTYERKTGTRMLNLDIFQLLEAEALSELPTCPQGGSFHRRSAGAVSCSVH